MRSCGPCLENILCKNVGVDGGGREFGTQRRDKGMTKELSTTMDESRVIISIQMPRLPTDRS